VHPVVVSVAEIYLADESDTELSAGTAVVGRDIRSV
jgi:hypothetical protein